MRILVVEDDEQLAELLDRLLRDDGHAAVVCSTLKAAREQVSSSDGFDVIVLDRMLPDGDGIELCESLRGRPGAPPILMLTARGEVQDRVAGLRTGADDYLTKPFEVEELLARLEALHRRTQPSWTTSVGELEVDRRAQIARLAGKRLELTAREYALLARLADCPDEAVSRATLLADVWNMTFDPGSGVIDVHVSRLRDKLGAAAWMIETVRGVGLRLRTHR